MAAPEGTRTASATRFCGTRSARSPRHGRCSSAAALAAIAVALATLILAPPRAAAQTPLPGGTVNLLQPSLEGNPATPPRFGTTNTLRNQSPPLGSFAPSRIGATPLYGEAAGFGVGTTGFDSTNTGQHGTVAQAAPDSLPGAADPDTTFEPAPDVTPAPPAAAPAAPPIPPPEIYPRKAASRPGAALPPPSETLPVSNPPAVVYPVSAANRPGAVLPIPPAAQFQASAAPPPLGLPPLETLPLGTVPQRPLPIGTTPDPYEALGIKAGSFLVLPAITFSGGADTNPQHAPGGGTSLYYVVAPELHVRSDWDRNSLTADIVGSYTGYTDTSDPSLNHPFLNSKIDGTVDVTRDTQIIAENRFIVATDNPGSPNLIAGIAKLPINTTVGGTLGVVQNFGRFTVTAKGAVDRSTYDNSVLTNGEQTTNDDRNLNQYTGTLRGSYELDPGFKPFVELDEDARVHDLAFDRNDEQRDSLGTSAEAGADLALANTLTGEMAVGYLERTYKDPGLPNIQGVIANGALLWQATALTSAKLSASSTVGESIVDGTSGSLSRDVDVEIDHAFRRWLILALQGGRGTDDYVGSTRFDTRYFASMGLTYKMNRDIWLNGQVRQDWLTSTAPGVAYTSTSFLVGLKLQR